MNNELIKSARILVICASIKPDEPAMRRLREVPKPAQPFGWEVDHRLWHTADLAFDDTFCRILKCRWSLLELDALRTILQNPESSVIFASPNGFELRSAKFDPTWGLTWESVFNTPRPEGT